MNSLPVNVAVEGNSDEALARALLRECELPTGVVYVQKGKDNLDKKLKAFNQAANHAPWLVLRDLDRDAACAPELWRYCLRNGPHTWFCESRFTPPNPGCWRTENA
ncbi:MAG: hypothetical protein HYX68_17170 [Planctomycetes bacterium]|jgi:hypothetical protein|nr:hypothetical protein [Planctomycetota bacterium]